MIDLTPARIAELKAVAETFIAATARGAPVDGDAPARSAYNRALKAPTVLALLSAHERMAEALGWYAEHVGSCRKNSSEGDAARSALDRDGGARASAALDARSREGGE